jgi:signal transduction histidine kinase
MRRTNLELEEKARCSPSRIAKVEEKNREVEQARIAVEEKAQQLAAHLQVQERVPREHVARAADAAQQPAHPRQAPRRKTEMNLSPKQVEYAKTIHASGGDLLALINEILDLSKVEAGKMQIEPRTFQFVDVPTSSSAASEPVADQKGLELNVESARRPAGHA